MSNFIFSLNATVPIFLVILLGWVLMQKQMLTKEFASVADKFVFKIALPCMLFKDIATANIKETFDLTFLLFCMITTTVMFLTVWLLTALLMKDKSMVGAFIQASVRGSSAVLGIAFVQNIYGNSGMAPMMIIAAVPLYNIFSVIILTFHSNDDTKDTNKIKTACINVLKNPIIIAIFVALIVALLEIPIPTMAQKTVDNVAATATPLALLVVGATFEGKQAISKIKPTALATFIKLILLPTLFLPLAYLFGFRNSEMVSILVMLASPTTVTCYIMAKNMHNDAVLSSSIVVTATLFSSVTLTMWVYILRSLSLI